MISIEALEKSYGKKSVLSGLELKLEKGKAHGIVGLNGAGKTTLFNCLAGYDKPTAGTISWEQEPLKKRHVAYLETQSFFYSRITGQDYLDLFKNAEGNVDIAELNKLLKLPLNRLVSGYSTGMKKKLGLLATLLQNRPILLLDEPFNGLDIESNKVLEVLIEELKEQGKTILLSSHILAPLQGCANIIHHLEGGRIANTYYPTDYAELDDLLLGETKQIAKRVIRDAFGPS